MRIIIYIPLVGITLAVFFVVLSFLLLPEKITVNQVVFLTQAPEEVYRFLAEKKYFKKWEPFQEKTFTVPSTYQFANRDTNTDWTSAFVTNPRSDLYITWKKVKDSAEKLLSFQLQKNKQIRFFIDFEILDAKDSAYATELRITITQPLKASIMDISLERWEEVYGFHTLQKYLNTFAENIRSNIPTHTIPSTYKLSFYEVSIPTKVWFFIRDTLANIAQIPEKVWKAYPMIKNFVSLHRLPFGLDSILVRTETLPYRDTYVEVGLLVDEPHFLGTDSLLRHTPFMYQTLKGKTQCGAVFYGLPRYKIQVFDSLLVRFPILTLSRKNFATFDVFYPKQQAEKNPFRKRKQLFNIH